MKKLLLLKSLLFLCALFVGTSAWADTTVVLSVETYASTNSWADKTAYSSIIINSDITATGLTNGNNSKYYETNKSWRHYESNSGTVTITTTSGVLKAVTFTYAIDNNGVLQYGGSDYTSGTKCINVNGKTSATFTVGHSSGDKTGIVQITSITVIYGDSHALPFSFDGVKGDITNNSYLAQSGLGDDYGSSPKLSFASTGNYVLLAVDEAPGILTYDIKGNSFSGGTFKVQTSANGSSFTDLKSYESVSGSKQSETFDNLAADVRFIKWIYVTKDKGNVALGNIKLTPRTDKVTVGASKYAAYCSAYALDFTDTDVKAYKAKVEGGKVALTQVDKVPANTGVILYCATPDTYDVPVIASASAVTENELIGVTVKTPVTWESDGKYNYILQSGQFKKASSGNLKANRAYLHTSYDVTAAGARDYLEFSFEDDVTGISDATRLNDNEKLINDNCFDLQGRRVAQPTKGLYIVNGKKVIIK